jgi:hypothetical protein
LTGATLVGAQDLVQPDGRINQVAHFGGDHIYCDSSSSVVVPPVIPGGVSFLVPGFFLLNSNGQVLWRVPGESVLQALGTAELNGDPVLVATGWGTYGPTTITVREATHAIYHTYVNLFTFTGYDEWGHANSLNFANCDPVAPPGQAAANPGVPTTEEPKPPMPPTPTDESPVPTDEPPITTPEPTEEVLMCVDEVEMIELPCDECPGGYSEETLKCLY